MVCEPDSPERRLERRDFQMGKLTQSDRVAELTTPLGPDVLVLQKFDGVEGLGELFEFRIDALSEQSDIDFNQALGKSCTIKLKAYQGKVRYFDGILTRAEWVEKIDDLFHYRLVLRPWFHILDYRADCCIFLDKNVKDIIQDVFTRAGFSDFEFRTTENYDPIPYCVQYRETDFAFCSRLMERYGIYYFFEHSQGKHTLVMADSRSSHRANPDVPTLPYLPLQGTERHDEQLLGSWVAARRFATGKVQFNDYDYLQPNKKLLAPNEGSENYSHAKMEIYDYPGKYKDEDKGMNFSKIRLQAEQALDHRRHCEGDAASAFPGSLITLDRHPIDSENREYLVLRSSHRYGVQHYRTGFGGAGPEEQVYFGDYEFLPSDQPFRMLPLTPKPRICGIQTAIVVPKKGDSGEEISTDENGHIWVQFYWDREPKISCPIRVAHSWSGKQWGTQFIPRIGMEVVVEFLEGDPDRPLVTGCVYNGDNKFPYDLPGNKTQSGTKSDSSKGHNGYNEFMFEDLKGSELIRMHAQKDHLVVINANQTGSVGAAGPDAPPMGGDQTWTVGGNRSWTIQKGNDTMDVQMGNQTITVDMGSQTVSAMQGITLTVCMGASMIIISPDMIEMASPNISLTAEVAIALEAGMTIALTAPTIELNGTVLINGMVPMTVPV